jgi:phthalate 4,5-cis-dihydrodiol dehydrogenase
MDWSNRMPPGGCSAPSRTLRFGIVGLGQAATATAPAIARHPHLEIVAAADSRPEAVDAFVHSYAARAYANIEALCADPRVEAVYVATPTHLHTQHVLVAARHGKHIIVEKPLAIRLEDADAMIEAAESAGVQLIVGQSQSYEPPIRAMRELVRGGQIGPLRLISGWYFNDWLYRPRLPAELETRLGGGVVFRQGAHHFDIARLIGGGRVRSVRATTGVWDGARPTEGSYAAFLEFEDGAAATLVYNGYDHFHTTELTGVAESGVRVDPTQRVHAAARRALHAAAAHGGEAALKRQRRLVDGDAAPERAHSHFGILVVSCERGDIRQTPTGLAVYGDEDRWEIPLPTSVVGRDLMVAELYQAVAGGSPPLHSGRWAKATLEVSLAVLESSRSRREVLLRHQVPVND